MWGMVSVLQLKCWRKWLWMLCLSIKEPLNVELITERLFRIRCMCGFLAVLLLQYWRKWLRPVCLSIKEPLNVELIVFGWGLVAVLRRRSIAGAYWRSTVRDDELLSLECCKSSSKTKFRNVWTSINWLSLKLVSINVDTISFQVFEPENMRDFY